MAVTGPAAVSNTRPSPRDLNKGLTGGDSYDRALQPLHLPVRFPFDCPGRVCGHLVYGLFGLISAIAAMTKVSSASVIGIEIGVVFELVASAEEALQLAQSVEGDEAV